MAAFSLEKVLGRLRAAGTWADKGEKDRDIKRKDFALRYEPDHLPMPEPSKTRTLLRAPKTTYHIRLRTDLAPDVAKRFGRATKKDPNGKAYVAPIGARHDLMTNTTQPEEVYRFTPGAPQQVAFEHAVYLLLDPVHGQYLEEVSPEELVKLLPED